MKIYVVKDNYQGTFDESGEGYSIDSVWDNEDIANAVANSRYAHSVDDYEVGTDLPEYAREAYEKILRDKKEKEEDLTTFVKVVE